MPIDNFFDVICIGDVAVDSVYRVGHLPGKDEKVDATFIGKFIGGTTCNTARALSQLGRSVKFFTLIGNDEDGDFIQNQLKKSEIDLQVIQSEGVTTPATQILISDDGEKAILLFFSILDPKKIEVGFKSAVLPKTTVFFTTGFLPGFQQMITDQTPIVISLEKPTLQKSTKPYEWAIKHAHTLVLDRHSFQFIFNKKINVTSLENVLSNQSLSISYLIITMGEQGVIGYSVDQKQTIHFNAHKIQPVDTTGAGDIFNAAFIHAYYFLDFSFKDSLRFSNAISAAACEEPGTLLSKKAIQRGIKLFQEKGGAI